MLGKELAESVLEELGLTALELLGEYKGAELEGLVCEHPPLFDRDSLVILGGHVTLEAGTGCVHTAPPATAMRTILWAWNTACPSYLP